MTTGNGLLVVIATYNEIDCLPRLVERIGQRLPAADVLVIDDNSPDGTGDWCDQAVTENPRLSVIHRSGKLGLGSATVTGFARGLTGKYELIATMDADLSHDPAALASMVDLMQRQPGCDVMIGSRYIAGGSTEGWPWTRVMASRTVNAYARWMLGLATRDNSGAFRIYRSLALRTLMQQPLKSPDYAYLEEILWRLKLQGANLREFPITFRNRELGTSKTNPLLGVKVFWQITRMAIGWW